MRRNQRTASTQSYNMARELPVIKPGDVITYELNNDHYTSVVIEVSGFDANGYPQLNVYDLLTSCPNARATVDNPIDVSLDPLTSRLTVYDYADYCQQYPELFI